ncbi:abortive infection family protein [Corynebacterium auriscanis]|uniref:abortive infection family protein n=1 Tax=Corynebacterium auriscanis TaxID=99807 RepID=UPI003CEC5602
MLSDKEKIIELLESQANILITTGTGGGLFNDFEEQYKADDRALRKSLQTHSIEMPFPWRSLWEWHGFYSQNLGTYADRRREIGSRKNEALDKLEALAKGSAISTNNLAATAGVVSAALSDADILLMQGRPLSAVDRVHTALHGHLHYICKGVGIDAPNASSLTGLMKTLRGNHPKLSDVSGSSNPTGKILNGLSSIIGEMNTIRNNHSLAHPNENLLGQEEARLCVDAGKLILNYLDGKLGGNEKNEPPF